MSKKHTLPPLPELPLIAFDLDGTLTDTEKLSLPDIVTHLNEDYGVPITLEYWHKNYHGLAGQRLINRIAEDFNILLPTPQFFMERAERIEKLFQDGLDPAPGMLQVVRILANSGQRMCICSNSPPERVNLTLRNIRGQRSTGINLHETFGGHVISAQEPGRPALGVKPSPEVYLAVAAHYGVTPSQCLAIEDTATGVTSAAGAGFTCWGYTGLCPNPEESAVKMKKAGAKKIFHHWDDFLPLLAKFKPASSRHR